MSDELELSSVREHLAARVGSCCYVCGLDNPRGLQLVFERGERGEMSAAWIPDSTFEGFEGIIHGGIVSTVLDESMAKAVHDTGSEALTAELRVRFRHHVAAGHSLRVSGWVTERNKRIIRAEAILADSAGSELAHAWSSFLVLNE